MQPSDSQIILVTPPDRTRAASSYGLPLAHMAYRIGNGPHLYRANSPAPPKGGLMLIGNDGFDGQGDAAQFCKEVLREMTARGLGGIVFDVETAPTETISGIVRILGEQMKKRGLSFYLPECYGNYSDFARILIPSSLSGGSLQERLEEAIARYGAGRVCLGLERQAEDFQLPSPKGAGVPISLAELEEKRRQLQPSVFFSRELCTHYFTYMNNSAGHFILFDDAGSLQQKKQLAESLGIRWFFLHFNQTEDLLPMLLGGQPPSV